MNNIPVVTKYLLLTNIVVFLLQEVAKQWGVDLVALFGLHFFLADNFQLHQLFTYMFLHANLSHIFFNMFALWMFGRLIESTLGARHYLIYYIVCGVGAALFQMGIAQIDLAGCAIGSTEWIMYMKTPTVGASGAIFGLLLAFGLLHPNAMISLIFPPITLKAKWFVIIYGVLELLLGVSGTMSGVAHFAHIGGMFWGWLLLLLWRHQARKNNNYYQY